MRYLFLSQIAFAALLALAVAAGFAHAVTSFAAALPH